MADDEKREIQISGVAFPSTTVRARFGLRTGVPLSAKTLQTIMAEETAVDALSRLLTEAMQKCQTKDGRVDMRDVAHFVLKES